MDHIRKNRFRLIALLAIIGILAATLLPALAKAKDAARSTACTNHLHQMGIAMKMHLGDFDIAPIELKLLGIGRQ
jgi:type II secretory pathway pseudopilin PulG